MDTKNVFKSFVFRFAERIMVKGLGLIISIILARLIAPDVYGTLAIVSVFVSLAQSFVQSGLATALVQNQDTSESDYSTVFYISEVIALLAIIVLYFVTPIIADVYDSMAIILPLRVFSLSLLVGAFNSVQTAKMQREMRFKEMMVCNVIATIFSGIIGIFAAVKGFGLWALVVYEMSNQVIVTIAMLLYGKWIPRFYFSIERAKVLYGFGWKLLISSLLTNVYNEARTLVVGYKYSSADLAYYNKGYQFPSIIANTLDVSIQSVMLPVMSREQDKKVLLRSRLKNTLALSVFFVTPVMLGLAAVANTLIPLLLGDLWAPCVPLLCVFCISELMLPIKSSNLSLLKAIGRSDLYMKTEFIRRIIMILVLAVSIFCFDSVLIIAVGYAFSAWLDTYIIAAAVNEQIDYSWLQQMRTVWKSLFCGFVMYGIVNCMNRVPVQPVALLALQILVGAVVYLAMSAIMKNDSFRIVLEKCKDYLAHKTQERKS